MLIFLASASETVFAETFAPGLNIRKVYYGDGALKGEFQVRDGKLEGATKWYHQNGALGALLHYRKNRLHGSAKTFYDTGTVKKMAYYRDGHLMTRWIFDQSGILDRCDDSLAEEK